MQYWKVYLWLGSKFRIQPQLQAAMLHTDEYYELFLGSGATFLNRAPALHNRLCDKDANIVNVWRVMADEGKAEEFRNEFLSIPVDKCLFDEFRKLERTNKIMEFSDVERALITFYLIVYSFDGNRKNMRYGTKEWEWQAMQEKAKKQLIANWENWRYHAKNAEIVCGDAIVELKKICSRENAMVYLDPPYVPELLGVSKNLYKEKFDLDQHVEMLQLIQDAKARIMLSGYRGESMLYDQYLNHESGWHCYELSDRVTKACVLSKNGKAKGFASEYIWVNYDLPESCRYVFPLVDLAVDNREQAQLIAKKIAG